MKLRAIRSVRGVLVVAAFLAPGCASHAPAPAPAAAPAAAPASRSAHELLDAVLWAQTAVEHELLCRQAYTLAAEHVERALADPSWTALPEQTSGYQSLPPAVVFDADETIIDNSEYEAELIRERRGYDIPMFDDEWVPLARARALPGAVEFTRWLRGKGVEPVVITNREGAAKPATLKNLLALGFAIRADGSTLLLREKPEWKEKAARRAFVARSYRVLLLLGDDLGDFVTVTGADLARRRELVAAHEREWGVKWILLPNAMYGSWERALYPPNVTDEAERVRLKTEALKGFRK